MNVIRRQIQRYKYVCFRTLGTMPFGQGSEEMTKQTVENVYGRDTYLIRTYINLL